MKLELGHSLQQKLEAEQKLTQESRLALRQEIQHQLQQEIQNIIDVAGETKGSRDERLGEHTLHAIDSLAKSLPEEARELLENEGFKSVIIGSVKDGSARLINGRIKEAVVGHLANVFSGDQTIVTPGKEPDTSTTYSIKLEKESLRIALEDIKQAEESKNELEELVRDMATPSSQYDNVDSQIEELRRQREVLLVAKQVEPLLEGAVQVLPAVLSSPVDANGMTLKEALVDELFIEKLHREGILSERIIKQMNETLTAEINSQIVRAYKKTGELPDKTQTLVRNTLSNGLAKAVLTGLGVIDSKLFLVRRGDNSDFQDPIIREQFKEDTGFDPIELLIKHNLTPHGEFFYSRYATKGVNPTAETDNKIRDFITGPAREASLEALQVADLETKIAELMGQRLAASEKTKAAEKDEYDDPHVQMMAFIKDVFSDEKLIESIRNSVRQNLSKELEGLMTA